MNAMPMIHGRHRKGGWLAAAILLTACAGQSLQAQTISSAAAQLPSPDSLGSGSTTLVPVSYSTGGCASCGASNLSPGCDSAGGCGGSSCVPGRDCVGGGCYNGVCGRLFGGFIDCVCCPDPCYEPKWLAIADSAFFVEATRPQTQMKLRWDAGFNLRNPDRAEYFWARQRLTNGGQILNPGGTVASGTGKGPLAVSQQINYQDINLVMEAAAGNFGLTIETPYRHVTSDPSSATWAFGDPGYRASGFGDLVIGTKALLLDCELMQASFGFKTFIPTGAVSNGAGTGHTSLEPSLLWSIKLSCDAYFQGQVSFWIPIGGDDLYQGNVFHSHFSVNKSLWRPTHNIQVVGTIEANEWTFCNGSYTNTDFIYTAGGNTGVVMERAYSTMVSVGPGVRMFICDKIDVGVGTALSLTGDRWAEELIRTEFRWRF